MKKEAWQGTANSKRNEEMQGGGGGDKEKTKKYRAGVRVQRHKAGALQAGIVVARRAGLVAEAEGNFVGPGEWLRPKKDVVYKARFPT